METKTNKTPSQFFRSFYLHFITKPNGKKYIEYKIFSIFLSTHTIHTLTREVDDMMALLHFMGPGLLLLERSSSIKYLTNLN